MTQVQIVSTNQLFKLRDELVNAGATCYIVTDDFSGPGYVLARSFDKSTPIRESRILNLYLVPTTKERTNATTTT